MVSVTFDHEFTNSPFAPVESTPRIHRSTDNRIPVAKLILDSILPVLERATSPFALPLSSAPLRLTARDKEFTALMGSLTEFMAADINWDGEGGVPAPPETIADIRKFLASLPKGYPLPGAAMAGDGSVTIAWRRPGTRVMLEFDGSGNYSAVIKSHLAPKLFDDVPSTIVRPEILNAIEQNFIE